MTHPQIYIACLAAYNNGVLHGDWIDASTDLDSMQEEVNGILLASPIQGAEEYAIHDHQDIGDVSEYASLQEIAKRMEAVEAAEDANIPASVLMDAINDTTTTDADPVDFIGERYEGSANSWKDFAEEYTENTQDMDAIPDWLRYHIDYDSIAIDFECAGGWSVYEYEYKLYFFRNQ